jgi:hypothetical protein
VVGPACSCKGQIKVSQFSQTDAIYPGRRPFNSQDTKHHIQQYNQFDSALTSNPTTVITIVNPSRQCPQSTGHYSNSPTCDESHYDQPYSSVTAHWAGSANTCGIQEAEASPGQKSFKSGVNQKPTHRIDETRHRSPDSIASSRSSQCAESHHAEQSDNSTSTFSSPSSYQHPKRQQSDRLNQTHPYDHLHPNIMISHPTNTFHLHVHYENVVPNLGQVVSGNHHQQPRPSATYDNIIPSTDCIPTLPALICFPKVRGGKMNITAEITNYFEFGILLLEDDVGRQVSTIVKESEDIKSINRRILQSWLQGKGRQPVTWNTLIQVLNDSDMPQLAKHIEENKRYLRK